MNTKDLKTIALAAVAGLTLCANVARADEVQELFDKIYPVGSIYISVGDTLPTSFTSGGMTWVKLTDGQFLMSANGTTTAGTTGGANSMTLKTENMPAHTHGPGTLNLEGQFGRNWGSGLTLDSAWHSGPFYAGDKQAWGPADDKQITSYLIKFKAQGNWTGATSSVGSNKAFDNRPAYLAVSMWKRTN